MNIKTNFGLKGIHKDNKEELVLTFEEDCLQLMNPYSSCPRKKEPIFLV